MTRRTGLWLPALLLLATTLGVLGWVVHSARNLRNEARSRFFEQYNRQQLLVAEQASRTIEGLFATYRRNLTLVTSLFRDGEVTASRAAEVQGSLETVYRVLGDTPVIDLVLFDRHGTVVAIVPKEPATLGQNYSWRGYYRWARHQGRPGQMYLSPFLRLEGGQQRGAMAILVAEGIYGPDGEFKGVAMITVNFDELARRHVLSVRMGDFGYAWLLDSNNRSILIDPRGKITGQGFEQAFLPRWPKLHALAEATRKGEPTLDWYDYEDPRDAAKTVRKLVGHAPIRIEGSLWTLGVCTPEDEVERLLSSYLDRQQAFSAALVLATLAAAGALLLLLFTWNRSLSRQVDARTADLLAAQRKLETTFEELLSTKKIAAVGHLALGLAHEIRNPLSSIRMNMQMLRKRVSPESPSWENFEIMEEEILRLNKLLTDVMSFARPAPLNLGPTDLRAVLDRVLRLFSQRMQGAQVEASLHWGDDCPPVLCDGEQLQQVFINLVLNAVQALEAHPGPRQLTLRGNRSGDDVSVEVADSGPGVPAEKLDHLFDPFFTSKANGTGLGLSIVQRIVLRHGGSVRVESPAGRGAIFTVTLPLSGPPETAGAEA